MANGDCNAEKQFLIACFKGDLDTIKELVCRKNDKPAILSSDEYGRTGLLLAVEEGHLLTLKFLLTLPHLVDCVDVDGRSALHYAASAGNLDLIDLLLSHGLPWNILDNNDITAGELARNGHHRDAYDMLVNAGVKAEFVLGMIERNDKAEILDAHMGDPRVALLERSNDEYLKSKLEYKGEDKLLDDERNAVMMDWELPLMRRHAQAICHNKGRVLNIGFGMGIVDREIQLQSPEKHVIIEAHGQVYQRMLDMGWAQKPNVVIKFGRWQDVLPQLGVFDGIFFDTYSEDYEDQRVFQKEMIKHLNKGGVYSFYNGLGARNVFFHDVYCRIASLELDELGLTTSYEPMDVSHVNKDHVWKGIKERYWTLDTYNLPVCRFAGLKYDEII